MEVTWAHARAPQTTLFPVSEPSQVGEARRGAAAAAEVARLDAAAVGRLSVIATELATNLAKHAHGGALLIRPILEHPGHPGVELLAVDRGPGIPDASAAMRDGFSTGGTRGAGLGAVGRMSDSCDIYSNLSGTAIVSRVWGAGPPRAAHGRTLQVGAVCTPAPNEHVAGDGWVVLQQEGRTLVVVADGLGHGPDAAVAAEAAAGIARDLRQRGPAEVVERMHLALRSTRGAAVAVCELEQVTRQARFAGIGNISAALIESGASRSLTSHTGIVGHQVRKVQEFVYAWPAVAVLVLHSDGVATRWRLDQYPGLAARHPSLIAGVLHRDHLRGRDDATVLVLRETQHESAIGAEARARGPELR